MSQEKQNQFNLSIAESTIRRFGIIVLILKDTQRLGDFLLKKKK